MSSLRAERTEVALDSQTSIVVSRGHVHCELSGSVVILDRAKSNYFEVDRVGARIWQLIQQPTTLGEICSTLVSEYDVSVDECSAAARRFVGQLLSHDLVELNGPATD